MVNIKLLVVLVIRLVIKEDIINKTTMLLFDLIMVEGQ